MKLFLLLVFIIFIVSIAFYNRAEESLDKYIIWVASHEQEILNQEGQDTTSFSHAVFEDDEEGLSKKINEKYILHIRKDMPMIGGIFILNSKKNKHILLMLRNGNFIMKSHKAIESFPGMYRKKQIGEYVLLERSNND
jgi:hypothetical protein